MLREEKLEMERKNKKKHKQTNKKKNRSGAGEIIADGSLQNIQVKSSSAGRHEVVFCGNTEVVELQRPSQGFQRGFDCIGHR